MNFNEKNIYVLCIVKIVFRYIQNIVHYYIIIESIISIFVLVNIFNFILVYK